MVIAYWLSAIISHGTRPDNRRHDLCCQLGKYRLQQFGIKF